MGPFLAWLPFLAALMLAFASGVIFARINEGLVSVTSTTGAPASEPPRRRGLSRLYRADFVLTSALIGLLVAVLIVWLVAVLSLLHGRTT